MLPTRFEPAVLASEPPQTHALDRAATGFDAGSELMVEKINHYEGDKKHNIISSKFYKILCLFVSFFFLSLSFSFFLDIFFLSLSLPFFFRLDLCLPTQCMYRDYCRT
jgi:hypothetical protein